MDGCGCADRLADSSIMRRLWLSRHGSEPDAGQSDRADRAKRVRGGNREGLAMDRATVNTVIVLIALFIIGAVILDLIYG